MILPEDIYQTIAKANKLKLNLINDPRPEFQKKLANEIIDEILFVLQELKHKL